MNIDLSQPKLNGFFYVYGFKVKIIKNVVLILDSGSKKFSSSKICDYLIEEGLMPKGKFKIEIYKSY